MTIDEIKELIADFMHDQWSHWETWRNTQTTILGQTKDKRDIDCIDFSLHKETYDRWKRQMETPYADLSEKEKDSDREWAKKLITYLIEKGVYFHKDDLCFHQDD